MGHLSRMLPIARALSMRKHQVVLFLYNPHECTKIIARERLPILPVLGMAARIPEIGTPPLTASMLRKTLINHTCPKQLETS